MNLSSLTTPSFPYCKSLTNDTQAWANRSLSQPAAMRKWSGRAFVLWWENGRRWNGAGECRERLVSVEQIFSHFWAEDLPGCFHYWDAQCAVGLRALLRCKYEESCKNTTCRFRLNIRPQKYLEDTSPCMDVRRKMTAYLCVLQSVYMRRLCMSLLVMVNVFAR